MDPGVIITQFVGTLVQTLLTGGTDAVGTAAGAVVSLVGSVVGALAGVAANVVSLLPPAEDLGLSIPSGWLVGYALFNTFIPLSEILAFFGIMVAAAVLPIAWHLGVTLYHMIPKPFVGT